MHFTTYGRSTAALKPLVHGFPFRLYISGFRYFTSRDDDMDDLYMFYITGYFGLVRRSGSGVGPPAPELCKWN
jgi:hypothetical protein